MQLNASQRRALLDELATTQTDGDRAASLIEAMRGNHDFDTADAFEVKHFLAQQRIKTIQAALIENEIDY